MGEYVSAFHKAVVTSKPPASTWPSDLQVPRTAFEDLVSVMSPPVKQVIGLNAVEFLQHHTSVMERADRVIDNFTSQVWSGECVAFAHCTSGGAVVVERVTFSVELCIERAADGAVFAQIGTLGKRYGSLRRASSRSRKSAIIPNVRFPSRKKEDGEDDLEVLEDVIRGRLLPFAGALTIDRTEESVEAHDTLPGRLRDKDRRRRFYARLSEGLEIEGYHVSPIAVQKKGSHRLRSTSSQPTDLSWLTVGAANARWMELLSTHPVYAFKCDGVITLYCWMLPQVMESLQSSDGQKQMMEWVKRLNIDTEMPDVPDLFNPEKGRLFSSNVTSDNGGRTEESSCSTEERRLSMTRQSCLFFDSEDVFSMGKLMGSTKLSETEREDTADKSVASVESEGVHLDCPPMLTSSHK